MIDVHCHILPGLDDGPKTMEGAVEMCAIARADGVETIVATPHMLNGLYKVEREDILAGVAELNQACGKEGINISILPGADIRVDHELGQLLEAAKTLEEAGAKIERIVAVIDRGEGGRENIEKAGYSFESILTKGDLGIA